VFLTPNEMATKNGIGYSPLSDKVYLGKQNTEKGMWIGAKQDVTNQFIEVSFAFFEENTIRNIGSSSGKENLFINVKNDKEGIEKIIKNLNKRLVELT
jgi:hypothetical protein